MPTIVARQVELAKLDRLYASASAEFIAIIGRRRIGKTFLINQYFKERGIYFEVTGTIKATQSEQLRNFHDEFMKVFVSPENLAAPKNWPDAMLRLKDTVEQLPKEKKVILFFDELPWLATPKSGLLQALDYYWNRHFSRMDNVILVICGSAAAWMIQHVIRDKGGLYGRLSDQIYLQPFTLHETELYLKSRNIGLDRKQIALMYMVMGGVAKYLHTIRRGLSTAQIINEVCFTPQGSLLSEFTDLYRSLFGDANLHMQIVRILAKKRRGMSRTDLLTSLNKNSGGKLTLVLDELEASGFTQSFQKFGQRTKDKLIRLSDEYTYFYLEFIDDVRSTILYDGDENYWQKMQSSQRWISWSGYSFEMLCFKHIKPIKRALGISAIMTEHSHWTYRPQDETEQGVEIDLIIDRADHCINLCEIKFCRDEFVITKEYALKLELKRSLFREKTGTKKAIFITLITPYGVKKNDHAVHVVDAEVTLDELFD